jgi:hypothetical protein
MSRLLIKPKETAMSTLTRIVIVLSLTVALRGNTPNPKAMVVAGASPSARSVSRFVDDVEGCREQPVSQPVAPSACDKLPQWR